MSTQMAWVGSLDKMLHRGLHTLLKFRHAQSRISESEMALAATPQALPLQLPVQLLILAPAHPLVGDLRLKAHVLRM